MKKNTCNVLVCVALGSILLTACQPRSYQLQKVESKLIPVNAALDGKSDEKIEAILFPYKQAVDSVMNRVIGASAMTMVGKAPESLLSNLVADVLKDAAVKVLGKPADMGAVNMGGLRNSLPKGKITCGNIFEILPFENSLCVLTLKGSDIRSFFEGIAVRKGEGLSGAKLNISPDGKLLSATIDGKPIDDEKLYTVSTVDYLADGNDGMSALVKAVKRECPEGVILRDLFINYVEGQTKAGKEITSQMEGRITIELQK